MDDQTHRAGAAVSAGSTVVVAPAAAAALAAALAAAPVAEPQLPLSDHPSGPLDLSGLSGPASVYLSSAPVPHMGLAREEAGLANRTPACRHVPNLALGERAPSTVVVVPLHSCTGNTPAVAAGQVGRLAPVGVGQPSESRSGRRSASVDVDADVGADADAVGAPSRPWGCGHGRRRRAVRARPA